MKIPVMPSYWPHFSHILALAGYSLLVTLVRTATSSRWPPDYHHTIVVWRMADQPLFTSRSTFVNNMCINNRTSQVEARQRIHGCRMGRFLYMLGLSQDAPHEIFVYK